LVVINAIRGRRVYLDTNIFIYAIEGYSGFVDELNRLFNSIDAGDLRAFTSEITLAEVLVKPLIDANVEIQTVYQQVLQSSELLEVIAVSRNILLEAARLRSICNLRLPDAIHGATAILSGCETFLTNDRRLTALPGIQVVVLSEVM
jgi:predicted nucleic acid-binding protein